MPGVPITLERRAGEVCGRGEPALAAVAIDEQTLLNLVQDLELEVLRRLGLQELQAEGVDRADEHLGHPGDVAQRLAGARDNPLLQLRGRLVGEGKGNNVPGGEPALTWCEEVRNTTRDYFGLAGAGARDELQVTAVVLDRFELGLCELHGLFGARKRAVIVTEGLARKAIAPSWVGHLPGGRLPPSQPRG